MLLPTSCAVPEDLNFAPNEEPRASDDVPKSDDEVPSDGEEFGEWASDIEAYDFDEEM